MNFIIIGLHCLDMRDFHSKLRATPFLDKWRESTIYIPHSRAQGHHQGDSLNAEMTGVWTARFCGSKLIESGYETDGTGHLPKTVIENLQERGYEILTSIGVTNKDNLGSWAVQGGMKGIWLKDQPDRLKQFNSPYKMGLEEWINKIRKSKKFYAHIFLRHTHRPWTNEKLLLKLADKNTFTTIKRLLKNKLSKKTRSWAELPAAARLLAIIKPDEFAELRTAGLNKADTIIADIVNKTKDLKDVTYLIYSNHGEIFDHFRDKLPHREVMIDGHNMIEGMSHGNYPYEVLYANMQMWRIPGYKSLAMEGIGRSIDICPTILDLANIPSDNMDGISTLQNFRSGRFQDRVRFAENVLGGGCISMVREDRFKFVSAGIIDDASQNIYGLRGFPEHRLAVFDLNNDPNEFDNLIKTDRGKEIQKWAIETHKTLKN